MTPWLPQDAGCSAGDPDFPTHPAERQQRELAGAGPLVGRGRVKCQQEADGGGPKTSLKRESQALEPQQDPPPSPMRPGTSGIVFMHFMHLRNGDSFHTCPASGTDVRIE